MKKLTTLTLFTAAFATTTAWGMEGPDPLLYMLSVDKLEKRAVDGSDPLVWEAEAWLGYDLQKLKLKAEGERAGGTTEDAELQLVYSHAVAPYWDLQAGVRHDIRPGPNRNWGAFALEGTAPYFIKTEASLFFAEGGQSAFRLNAEYELMLTQRWVLTPELEVNVYGKNEEERGIGSGLSDLELGLRLSYEIRREFAPYVGLNWEQKFGHSADFAKAEGEDTSDLHLVAGVRFWF